MREINSLRHMISTLDINLTAGHDPGHVLQCLHVQIRLDGLLAEEAHHWQVAADW